MVPALIYCQECCGNGATHTAAVIPGTEMKLQEEQSYCSSPSCAWPSLSPRGTATHMASKWGCSFPVCNNLALQEAKAEILTKVQHGKNRPELRCIHHLCCLLLEWESASRVRQAAALARPCFLPSLTVLARLPLSGALGLCPLTHPTLCYWAMTGYCIQLILRGHRC